MYRFYFFIAAALAVTLLCVSPLLADDPPNSSPSSSPPSDSGNTSAPPSNNTPAPWNADQCTSAYIAAAGKLNQCLQSLNDTIKGHDGEYLYYRWVQWNCAYELTHEPNTPDARDCKLYLLSALQKQYQQFAQQCMTAFEAERGKLISVCPKTASGGGPLYCGTRQTAAETCRSFCTDGDLLCAQCSKWLAPPALCNRATFQVGAPIVGEVPGCQGAYESTAPLFAACGNDSACLIAARAERSRLIALCLGQDIPVPKPKTATTPSPKENSQRTTTTLAPSARPGADLPRRLDRNIERRETSINKEKPAQLTNKPAINNLDRLIEPKERLNRPTQKIY